MTRPHTLGDLKASGYRSESVKDEMGRNLIARLKSGEALFPAFWATKKPFFPDSERDSCRVTNPAAGPTRSGQDDAAEAAGSLAG